MNHVGRQFAAMFGLKINKIVACFQKYVFVNVVNYIVNVCKAFDSH